MDDLQGLAPAPKNFEAGTARTWVAVEALAPSEASAACSYGLMEAGALGTETREVDGTRAAVTAYFSDAIDERQIRKTLVDALRIHNLPSSLVIEFSTREFADRDWLAEWKKGWQPVEVGERFLIAPPWCEIKDAEGRIVIHIEPGMAFGTGTHETTRLCLAAIEKYFKGGSFLDVGTGTGILAIAAAKLFPQSRIEACDTDADAVAIARANAQMNNVSRNVGFRVGTVDESGASADCVCANLTADVILPLLSPLLGATCGRLILSGILLEQIDSVQSSLNELGVSSPYEIVSDGEWAAIIV
ncbi:MAG: 50S ribosomal protein L11 methyltransferase [Pyrinomonadaceae bacterium]